MDFSEIFAQIAKKAGESSHPEPGDYLESGLLFCGRCHTAKQSVIQLDEKIVTVPCLCKCKAESWEREREERKRIELQDKAERLRDACFKGSKLAHWTFEEDEGRNPRVSEIMHRFVDNFPEMYSGGHGLLLYGERGTGKTFAAACAVNALISNGKACVMTNFSEIATKLIGLRDSKWEYMDRLLGCSLLAIDDLGAERETEYMKEIIFSVIDGRYRAKRPMIITTNLSMDEIKHPRDMSQGRVIDRILERCAPVEVKGENIRRKKIIEEYPRVKELLGL